MGRGDAYDVGMVLESAMFLLDALKFEKFDFVFWKMILDCCLKELYQLDLGMSAGLHIPIQVCSSDDIVHPRLLELGVMKKLTIQGKRNPERPSRQEVLKVGGEIQACIAAKIMVMRQEVVESLKEVIL